MCLLHSYRQRVADCARSWERRHVRRQDAIPTHLRLLQNRAQLLQRVAGEHGAGEETVGNEDAIHLAKRLLDVVRPVEKKGRHHQVGHLVRVKEESGRCNRICS